MLAHVIVIVPAQSEIVKMSQNWANHENKNYLGPGWEKNGAPLPAPLHFSHRQPMKTQHSFQPTCATLQKLKPLKLCCWPTLYLCIVMQLYGHAQHKLKSTPSWEKDSVTPSWEKDSVKVIMRIIMWVMWNWAAWPSLEQLRPTTPAMPMPYSLKHSHTRPLSLWSPTQ